MVLKRNVTFKMIFGCQMLAPLIRHINFHFCHTSVIHVLSYLFTMLRQLVRMLGFFNKEYIDMCLVSDGFTWQV